MINVPTVKYLFRYRDLIAPTLEAHRNIIATEKACWWGWWKRPLEPSRMEVWDDLELQLRTAPRWVGLFDSGNDKCYLAKVERVIRPQLDPTGRECEPLLSPAGEEALVPEYYRMRPFSRAWMRLTDINGELQIFGKKGYAYASAPPLENLDYAQLDSSLKGKVITSGAELRSMDTTIWEIMPASEKASEGQVLTFSARSTPALSGTPILLKHPSFLHITDPHFALTSHASQHAWRIDGDKGSKKVFHRKFGPSGGCVAFVPHEPPRTSVAPQLPVRSDRRGVVRDRRSDSAARVDRESSGAATPPSGVHERDSLPNADWHCMAIDAA